MSRACANWASVSAAAPSVGATASAASAAALSVAATSAASASGVSVWSALASGPSGAVTSASSVAVTSVSAGTSLVAGAAVQAASGSARTRQRTVARSGRCEVVNGCSSFLRATVHRTRARGHDMRHGAGLARPPRSLQRSPDDLAWKERDPTDAKYDRSPRADARRVQAAGGPARQQQRPAAGVRGRDARGGGRADLRRSLLALSRRDGRGRRRGLGGAQRLDRATSARPPGSPR
jgi:hypothetical protein